MLSAWRCLPTNEQKGDGYEGVDFINPETSEPWAKCYEGPFDVFFGHDARRMLQLWPSATGACVRACVRPVVKEKRGQSSGAVRGMRVLSCTHPDTHSYLLIVTRAGNSQASTRAAATASSSRR